MQTEMTGLPAAAAADRPDDAALREADFEAFVAARSGALLNMAYLLTQNRPDAEDLLQTTLARCWLAWRRITGDDPTPYARRVMINAQRTRWRRRGPLEIATGFLPEDPDAGRHQLVEHADLMQALRRLPKRMCAVVVLRYFEDLSLHETAVTMGCSVSTVKSQAHRAITKLRLDLAQQRDEEKR